ncbi:MAG: choice-of-anchor Q domain-containing protein, partial [Thermoguttaceae bacterium]|nr:choice-of-anchor Q domain-containing protein [Thermoguttaceae bacterium]
AGVYGTGIHNAGVLVVSNTLMAGNNARAQAASENENEFAQVYGTALYVAGGGTLDLIGSTLSGNEASVAALDSETVSGTLYIDCSSQSEIITVVNVYNSIIARNVATQGGDIALDDGATVYGANNLADFSGWDAASTNNIVFQANDELFVDADEGDYHLSPTSAAALKADPGYVFIRTSAVSWDALTDLDGNARVAGSGIDMGAYELAIVSEEYSMIEASPSLLITPVSDTQLKVEIIAVDRVQYYTVLYRASGETQWQTGCSTQSLQFSLDELEPDTQYEFMAVGVQESTDSTHTRVSQLYTGATPATGTQESPSLVVTTLLDIEDAYDNEISLREAVKYLSTVSGTNKTITFDTSLAGKTIELKHGVITIEESVVLDASNLNNHVVISGGGSSSILSIPTTTAEVTLKNLAFIDGYSDAVDGGAILSYCSSLTVIDCLFQDNKVAYSSATGGGAIASYGWTLVVESSGFYRNTVATASDSAAGGAIWCYGGGEITDCVFVQNSLINSVSNYVVGGGAIGTQSQMTVAASVFVENTAASGGAILAFATLTVTDSIFEGNSATIYGGGICMYQATASVSGTSFVDNHAQYGGGFCGYGNILKSVFQENVAEYGGGIHLSSSTTVRSVVTECLITGNRSQSAATYAWGGGVSVMGAATITNCTITKNVAGLAGERTGYGGGLGCLSASAAIVQNCIIVDNTTVDADGLYHVSDVSVSSTASYPIGKNVLTGSASVWNSTDSVNIIGYSQTSPLFVNAEAGDYSLVRSASSQALDAGDNSFVTTERTTDLAGATRIYGTKVDLGAYEVQAMTRQAVCAFVINDAATTDNSVTIDLSDSTGTGTGTGSQSYLVQCSNSPNFDTTVFSQTVVGTGLHEITGLEAAKDYFIRVRTVASGTGDASIWTSVQAWTTNARILATPVLETPVKAEDAVEFSWSAVEGATSYLIEYSQDETFTGVTRQILYDNAGSYRIDHVTPLGVWYFRVSALGMGTCSDSLPSEVKSVALLGMTLKYTLDSSSFTSRSTENEITIATFTVTGSSSYNYVLISTGSETLPLKVVNDKLVTNGTMTPGDYSIRVRAESSDETNVSNEVVVAFTVLTTPPDNITLSASQGLPNREAGLTIGILSATMYDANTPYWFTLVQTGDAAYFAMDTTTNTLKTAGALAASTTYQVTVRAQNAGGAFEKTFSIVTIAAPVAVPDHEEYTVAAGCQVQLSGTGTDESGRVITEYYWDTNGDGIADQTGQSIWVDSMSLNPDVQSRMATVDFWVRNDLDAQSVKQSISVTVDRITPLARVTPTVRVLDDDEGRIFVARVDMSVVGRENIRRWQFSWGDDSNGTDIAVITSSMCCAHYFASPGSYEVKLTITLTDGSSDVFSLGQFVFESPDVVLQASSAVVDESPLMVVDEPEVAIDSSQEQTAFDSALVAVTDEWHSCVVSERVLIDLASSEHWKKKRLSL